MIIRYTQTRNHESMHGPKVDRFQYGFASLTHLILKRARWTVFELRCETRNSEGR